jgi:hypothetical protein
MVNGQWSMAERSQMLKHSAQNIRPALLPWRAKGNGAENGGA